MQWIFEEEILSGSNELFFSPDSSKLAFLRFDDRCDLTLVARCFLVAVVPCGLLRAGFYK